MSGKRVREAFRVASEENRAALVAYLTHGDPSCEGTVELMVALAEAGVDVIELGVPFSDPSADGVTIQEAMERARAQGGGLRPALHTVRQFRDRGMDTPVVLFGYYNPIFVYGPERFAVAAADAGVDAVLTVDLPLEELGELHEPLLQNGVGVVPLVAPTTPKDRVERLRVFEPAFVYYVSMTGVTGSAFVGGNEGAKLKERVPMVRKATKAPVAVGFGIKSAADARRVAPYADGVVVGSAFVSRIGKSQSTDAASASVADLACELRDAMVR